MGLNQGFELNRHWPVYTDPISAMRVKKLPKGKPLQKRRGKTSKRW
jgi:hypothetical protein